MSQSKPKDSGQIARFKEAAKAIDADTSDGALDRAFAKLNPKKKEGGKAPLPPNETDE